MLFTTNVPNAGAIDEALLRPGRCFANVDIRRLTHAEARVLAVRLAGNADADRVLAQAIQPDSRSISTASVYQAWNRLKSAPPDRALRVASLG